MWQGLKRSETNLTKNFILVNFWFTVWCFHILLFSASFHITEDNSTKEAKINFHSLWMEKRKGTKLLYSACHDLTEWNFLP